MECARCKNSEIKSSFKSSVGAGADENLLKITLCSCLCSFDGRENLLETNSRFIFSAGDFKNESRWNLKTMALSPLRCFYLFVRDRELLPTFVLVTHKNCYRPTCVEHSISINEIENIFIGVKKKIAARAIK